MSRMVPSSTTQEGFAQLCTQYEGVRGVNGAPGSVLREPEHRAAAAGVELTFLQQRQQQPGKVSLAFSSPICDTPRSVSSL